MVSAVLNDALSDPLSVLTFLQHSQHPNDLPARVAAHFQDIFNHDDAFKQIPALDISHPPESYTHKSRPLVRFRAMVQDTSASPEVYISILKDGRLGGWGLAETVDDGALLELQHLREREVLWAVSVPGESPFLADHLDDADHPHSGVNIETSLLRHKDPLSREKHVGVQIKIYDSTVPPLKSTDLRTFVGFLTFEPISSVEAADISDDVLVPTLHTLFSVPTLLPFGYPAPNGLATCFSTIRDELVEWISEEALAGDRDAAEWVLLASIARVQSRQPPLFPPSLTLSRFPKPDSEVPGLTPTPTLVHVLRHIHPLFVYVPLTLSLLNARSFAPESHDESLHSGLLQLPAGTTLLFSDTGIQEGKVTEVGLRNIQEVRNILASQTLDYHFPFSTPYQFPTDLAFLFLTEGQKSAFVETHVNMPLECKTSSNCFKQPEEISLPSPTRLDAFRHLVGGAKVGKIVITDEVAQHIQDDFVHERQKNRATTADDLMTRMAIARLMALSIHDTELTREVWQRAKDLDERRKLRP